ncbi:MAG TPA: ATP-binding protein [Sedimentisphaerales bacterium]|nr:ATP-binding protein [Sedimentisphaerales bacterium]
MKAPICEQTMFAMAERATSEELHAQISLAANASPIPRMLDSIMDMALLLNRHRQIVFCNSVVVETFGLTQRDAIYGLRPGEAIGCINARRHNGGCGTAEHCMVCGAVNAILAALDGRQHEAECRILQNGGDAINLDVKATPFRLASEGLILLAMRDTSEQVRHQVMERMFHHDILNTACGIKLLSAQKTWSRRANNAFENIHKGITRLINEIQFQQDMNAAENGRLVITQSPIRIADLIEELVEAWKPLAAIHHCHIQPCCHTADISINTDKRLLARIISNMLKNAIEASKEGEIVAVTVSSGRDHLSVSVSNKAVIPKEHQLQIFQRSFSTKGHGRGIGTYSMKLLTEKYMGGSIGFTSEEMQGTVFPITLPLGGPLKA